MQYLMDKNSQHIGIKEKEKRAESREIVKIGKAVCEWDHKNEAPSSHPD